MTKKNQLSDVQEHEEYLEARDGTQVFMRSWLPQRDIEHITLQIHGTGGYSGSQRKIALALCEQQIATFVIDMRGFGHTGTRGDAKDFHLVLEDIVMALSEVRKRYPELPRRSTR